MHVSRPERKADREMDRQIERWKERKKEERMKERKKDRMTKKTDRKTVRDRKSSSQKENIELAHFLKVKEELVVKWCKAQERTESLASKAYNGG